MQCLSLSINVATMALGIGPTFKCYIHVVGMRSQNFSLSAVSTDI